MFAVLAATNFGIVACKKQPAATVPSEDDQQIAEAKRALQRLLTDRSMSIEDKEQELDRIKAMGLSDPEVLRLIAQVEEMIAKEKAEKMRLEDEERRRREEAARESASAPANRLSNYFSRISGAGSATEANNLINEALSMFSSPDTDVLIIVSKSASGEADYDRPTTIKRYLEYLKDQKKQADAIENIKFDNNGKIRELELTKLR